MKRLAAVSFLLVTLLILSAAVQPAAAQTNTITEPDCDGLIEGFWHEFYNNNGLLGEQTEITRSPCVQDVTLQDPSTEDAAWNSVDTIDFNSNVDKTITSGLVDGVSRVLPVEALTVYSREIKGGATETEAREAAEEAVYTMADNTTDTLVTKNDRTVREAMNALEAGNKTFVLPQRSNINDNDLYDVITDGKGGSLYNGNWRYCGIDEVKDDGSPSIDTKTIEYPSSSNFGDVDTEFEYVNSSEVTFTIKGGDSASLGCSSPWQYIDFTVSAEELSLIGQDGSTTGGLIMHGGIDGESAKNSQVAENATAFLADDYQTLDSSVSDGINELDTFRNGITKAELSDAEVPVPPSAIGDRADGDSSGATSLSLLGMANESSLPDISGANTSNITVDGTPVDDRIIAPDNELADAIGGNLSEGESVNLDGQPGGFFVVDPETGQQDYVDSGSLKLRDSPSGTSSEFDSFEVDAANQTRTLEEFRKLLEVTDNASTLDARYSDTSGAGFFGGDGLPISNTALLAILGVVVLLVAMRGGDS